MKMGAIGLLILTVLELQTTAVWQENIRSLLVQGYKEVNIGIVMEK